MEPQPPSPTKPSRWRRLRFHGAKAATATTATTATTTATAHEGVLRQGFLLKKGHRLPTTKERFFVLRPRVLSYFRAKQHASDDPSAGHEPAPPAEDARHLRGVIELAPSDLITPMATSRHWFLIQKLHGPDGKGYKLELRASSPEERQEWIDALRAASRDPQATAAQAAREAERERQLTRTFTMLRVRDASLLSTVLRQQQQLNPQPAANGKLVAATSVVDLRASFQVFHELVLLQSLVTQIRDEWGPPATWTCEQYDTLVQSIKLADHQTATHSTNGSVSSIDTSESHSVLGDARALQYAFEEVAENQHKLLVRREALATYSDNTDSDPKLSVFVSSESSTAVGRVRCPTIYSYLSTFERFVPDSHDASERSSSVSSAGTTPPHSARSSLNAPLSPRSATLAKYAHLYLEEEGRDHKPWSWDRVSGDDLFDEDDLETPLDAARVTQVVADRFTRDKIYAYVRHHTLLFVNPNRVLKTNRFTSIYDEHVVLAYAQTPFAQTQLAPHPFAMAKQALFRLFFAASKQQSMVLSGDSGSGKTELAKELLKYVVLTAQPPSRPSGIVLYTSSTKSTFQMRNEETRTLDLLHAKGITDYEVVLLDLTPDKWTEMTRVSKSKRLPQVHVGGLFFGYYETLQRLEDEEQLRMYFRNACVAKKLSSVLDANILLEAFAHAATPLNGNSSRYAKRVEIQLAFGRDPAQYQVLGCEIAPFLLEKSRVTGGSTSGQRNFHVLYALVHGLNATSADPHHQSAHSHSLDTLAKRLHLDACSAETFRYLSEGKSTPFSEREVDWKRKKDAERFQHIVLAMETVEMDAARQEAIFRVLSAVLWLGNLEFVTTGNGASLDFAGTTTTTQTSIATVVQELLALESLDALRSLVLQRRVEMASTGEAFDVQLSVHQARHARDTLARFLYDAVFHDVIAQLNEATRCPADDGGSHIHTLSIVDLFGFENFSSGGNDGLRNSLEQLCINYLTEKLASAELQLVAARFPGAKHHQDQEEPVLQLFEHPLGLFATLEEQTVLHQSEGGEVGSDDDQKKNQLFVRYLYQRNQARLRAQPSQLKQHALQFLVPHARDVVTYDAHDFVKKNSDFFPAKLLQIFETTTKPDSTLRAMVMRMKQQSISGGGTRQATTTGTAPSSSSSGGSLTSQFRTQIQHHVAMFGDPLFLHCFRANATAAWTSATHVDPAVLERQVRAHRIASVATLCRGEFSSGDNGRGLNVSVFEVSMSAQLFLTRFKCLAPKDAESATSLCCALEDVARSALDLSDDTRALLHVDEQSEIVRVRSLQIAETLELLLDKRQFEAATLIQAIVRMAATRKWYCALQADRRALTRELLELYGPNSTRKVERTLRKYAGGREAELKAKIAAKKQEKAAIAELASGMEAFLAHGGAGGAGGLDPALLDQVLRDREIQRQIAASDSRIVRALREMSLNPHQVLPKQLADPELRAFYQRMLTLLQTSLAPPPPDETDQVDNGNQSVEDRVRWLVTKHRKLWQELAHTPGEPWEDVCDKLDEIGDEPEMLLFYADDDAFGETLAAFVETVEAQVRLGTQRNGAGGTQTPVEKGDEEEESVDALVAQLTRVEFSATLMAAMQGDPFFVEALQSPPVVAAVHQLMTDRQAFAAAQSGLRSSVLREFFHRLVRLSEETRKHH